MVARETLEGHTADIRILATDIDTTVLGRAARGVYDEERMAPISLSRRERWFRPHPEGWEVRPELGDVVSFARLNLAQTPYPMRGPFNAIFCRNVMIYFGREVRQGILDEAGRLLDADGLFVVGRSEGLSGLQTDLGYQAPAVYARGQRMRGAA
jgi:chemotaxis protein methyltransferase CheR